MKPVTGLTTAERDAAIIRNQVTLLDHSGHVRPNITAAQRRALVNHINTLRILNGWKTLDMKGR